MAKRSVKKARQQQPAAAGAASAAPAAGAPRSRRPFWLGVLVAAALLVPAGVAGVLIASSGGDEGEPAQAAVAESIESEAEALRRQTQVRDREQVGELTSRMRETAESLVPVLDGFARTLPPGEEGETGPLATRADVQEWRRTVREADAYFEESPSGETGTNVARGGFSASVDALVGATEIYALALSQRGARKALLERARAQRDLAVRTWSVAATQLDAINIATGFGHQHVYLGGSEAAGGFGADPAPEGSGAESHDGHEDE